jgi:NodT family efflux transporter outer membrane factor (OMF) lipoprotein
MKRTSVKASAPLGLAAACLLVIAGCAAGPDYVRPTAPTATGYSSAALPTQTSSAPVQGGAAQQFVAGQDIPAQWWTLFRSPALNALIEHALKNNPNLAAADAALRVAQENLYAQQGAFFPTVTASYTPSRQKTPIGSLTTNATSGASLYTLHTAQLNVGYTLDVFGANRREVESLQAQADSQRFQLEAAYLSLTSNLVVAAVQEASLRGQAASTEALIKLEQEQLDLLKQQLSAGAIAEAGVVAQEAILAQTKASLPPLNRQLAQQRDLLVALAGHTPGDFALEDFDLAMLDLPQALPVSLPSKLVEQRPDIRSAEEQLHAASAQIGVAQANLLPQITLSATGGSVAYEISQLFRSGNAFWALAAGVTQPIFDGATLLHRKRAAEATYDQAAAQYRATVITAFQNVADALQALRFDADALQEAVNAERAADSSLAIAKRQVEIGDVSDLALLTAELAYQQSLINLVQARANRYADTAALFQALGGGWWNRAGTDLVSEKSAPGLRGRP